MGKACRVPGCNKLFKTKRSMFKVPIDETERKKWAVALPEIKDLKASHFICEKHFDSAFILRKYEKFDEIGKLIAEHVYQCPQLAANAIPNTPANIGSLSSTVHPQETGPSLAFVEDFSADTRICASSVPLSADSQPCIQPISWASIDHSYCRTQISFPVDLRNCTPTIQPISWASIDHSYCGMHVPFPVDR